MVQYKRKVAELEAANSRLFEENKRLMKENERLKKRIAELGEAVKAAQDG